MVSFVDAVVALVPPVGVGLVFWYALRAIIGADRRERAAIARLESSDHKGKSGE